VRPRQACCQAALRPDSMHIHDSTVAFRFPRSDLNSGACGLRAQPTILAGKSEVITQGLRGIDGMDSKFGSKSFPETRCAGGRLDAFP
jgi:hypothetical protein